MTHGVVEDQLDLQTYFRRIGYTGERTSTLATLQAIHLRHATAIPFENLTPLLHQPVRLDLASLQHKLVQSGRGGYCLEQNLLLLAVLRVLGFQVTGLAARVRWNVPDDVITARGHMLLRVELDGQTYLADVGFGGLTLTAPLALMPNQVQPTPHEPFRITDGLSDAGAARVGVEVALSLRPPAGVARLWGVELVSLQSPTFALCHRADGGPTRERAPLCAAQQPADDPPPARRQRAARPRHNC